MTQRAHHNHTSRPDAGTDAHSSLVALARQAARRDFPGHDPHNPETKNQDTDHDQ